MTGRRRLPDVVARLPKARAALEYAEHQHSGQRRSSDGAAFIEHPVEVGWLLYRAGASDHVIAAGVLHDILEKTGATAFELRQRFGAAITTLVRAVSEDEGIAGYGQRKAALRRQVAAAGPEALMIFAADKVSKVRELRSAMSTRARRGDELKDSLTPPRRLAHFRQCLAMLEERLGESSLVPLLRTELAQLNQQITDATKVSAAA